MDFLQKENNALKEALWRVEPREYFRLYPLETRVIEKILNDDCLFQIMKCLTTRDVLNAKLVCKRWYRVAQNEHMWKRIYDESFGMLNAIFKGTYRSFFEREDFSGLVYARIPKEDPKAVTIYELHLKLPVNCQGFGINFSTSNQILFHFNPRRNEGQIVCNSTTQGRGGWMWEERTAIPGKMLDRDRLIVYFVWSKNKICWILEEKLPTITYNNRFPAVEPEFIDLGGMEVERAIKYNTESIFCKDFVRKHL